MIHIVPGDPVEQMLGEGAAPEQLNQLRHVLGLDLPLHTQYGHYLWQLGHGDFGQSFKFQAPVRQIIFERYPGTLQLAFLALLFARRLPFLQECSPPIAAVKPPTALSEGVLVQNDW